MTSTSPLRAGFEPERWDEGAAPAAVTATAAWTGEGHEGTASRAFAPRRGRALGRLRLLAVSGDLLGVVLAAVLTVAVAPWARPAPSPGERATFVLASCAVIGGVLVSHARSRTDRIVPRIADDLGTTLSRLALAGVVLLALSAVGALRPSLPPLDVGILLGMTAAAVPATRRGALALASAGRRFDVRVLVVGSGPSCDDLCRRLHRSPLVSLVGVVGVVGVVGEGLGPGRRRLGRIEDLPELCATHRVDRVLVAFGGEVPARAVGVLQGLRNVVDVDVVVRYYELASWQSRLDDVTGLSVMRVGRRAGPIAAATKRALDLSVAALSLAVLGPFLAVVALAIVVESGGPALFRQTRIGRHHRPFEIVKFRTMHDAPQPAGPMGPRTPLAAPDPARVTRLGRFLRRSGIDELPQLVNVLRGDMSLVGPRPFVPEESLVLRSAAQRRFEVRPGLTGLWQVCGQHSNSFDELCRLDVQYATSWSLGGDLRILARTPGRIVHGSRP